MPQVQTERCRRKKRSRAENGSALLPVLSLVLAGSLLTIGLLAMSQLNVYTVSAHTKLQKSMYLCEGVANRVQYLISAERTQNPNTNMATFDYGEYDYDRYLPDGTEHTIDYHGTKMKFMIHDAGGGLDFSTVQQTQNTLRLLQMNSSTDTEYTEKITALQNQLTDYTDSDDSALEDGMEETEYQDLQLEPLPRNAALQFREELFYLPAFRELFPPDGDGRLSQVRLIVPDSLATITTVTNTGNQQGGGGQPGGGGQQGQRTTRTSIFSTNPNLFDAGELYLKNALMLEDSELAQVKEALQNYRRDHTKLEDSFDSTLFGKLQNSPLLNWTPGAAYTVTVQSAESASKRLVFSFTASEVSGPEDSVVRYLEWMFY